jgi:AcrR family transcriptional regulator
MGGLAPATEEPTAPRGPRARQKIFDATIELLRERGYAGLSVEAIAERCGVSKVTIYRWWPNKAAVAMDAFLALNAPQVAFPDTGSTKEDFVEHLKRARRFSNGPDGAILPALIAQLQHDPQLAEDFKARFWALRRSEGSKVLRRGIERGDVRPGIDLTVVLDALYAPVYLRQLVGHAKLDPAFCRAIVDTVFEGIATP